MSNINNSTINENFPIAGQDNDTQVFRDNFDSIKRNLGFARDEITDLQNRTGGLAATELLDSTEVIGSDFNNRVISNAIFRNNRQEILDLGTRINEVTIDYESACYFILRLGANVNLGFLNFPDENSTPRAVGKIFLEVYSDNSQITRVVTFKQSNSIKYKKINWQNDWNSLPLSGTFKVSSSTDPLILEAWSHSSGTIFVRNVGVAS